MAKLTPITIGNIGGNPTSAANNINTNSTRIQSAVENTLSRDGTSPNHMEADFDLNHNDLLNGGTLSADNILVAGVDLAQLLIALGLIPPGALLPFKTWRQVAAALADSANPAGGNVYSLIVGQIDPLVGDTASQQWEARAIIRANDSVYQLIQTTTGWNGTQMNSFMLLAGSKPL